MRKGMDNMQDLTEKQVSTELLYDGNILHVYRDAITLPNGKPATREYLKHQGAVCILPYAEDGTVVMERQFRYPFHQVILEAPAGKRDPGEDWLTAAKRELAEETGAIAETFIELGEYYPSVAYTDEVIKLYLARGLTYEKQHMDEDEFLTLERIPLDELVMQVLSGAIPDGKTQVILLKAWHALRAEG